MRSRSAGAGVGRPGGRPRSRSPGHRQQPAFPPGARLDPVEAPVDQDAREPDVERQFLAKRREVLIRLHERVLHRLVRLGRIAQVVVRDPGGAPLVPRHQLRVALARVFQIPARLHRLDGGGGRGIRFTSGDEGR